MTHEISVLLSPDSGIARDVVVHGRRGHGTGWATRVKSARPSRRPDATRGGGILLSDVVAAAATSDASSSPVMIAAGRVK